MPSTESLLGYPRNKGVWWIAPGSSHYPQYVTTSITREQHGARNFLFTMMAAIMIALGATQRASAQQVPLCTNGSYEVDLTAIPASMWACWAASGFNGFPVITSWDGVVWPSIGFQGYPGPGLYTEFPSVPPGALLDDAGAFGTTLYPITMGSMMPFISQTTVNTSCGPVCVVLCLDAQGCLRITAHPGACPAVPLPCS